MILLIISATLLFFSGFCFGRAYESWRAFKRELERDLWDAQ